MIVSEPGAAIRALSLAGVALGRWPWQRMKPATTLARRITLLGSAANLLFAESAQKRGVHLSFGEGHKSGLAIAILTLLLGIAWLERCSRRPLA